MVIVVGIDPSLTSSGVAILRDGKPVHVSHHGYSGTDGASWDSRNNRVVWTVGQIVNAVGLALAPVQTAEELIRRDWQDLDLVMIEGPSYGSQHGHLFDRAGLWHGVYAAFRAKRIRIAVVSPKTRAKWATGKDVEGNGNSTKRAVYEAVCAEWKPLGVTFPPFGTGGNDEADAITLAAMGSLWLGDELPIAVPQWRRNGLTSVAWPEVAV